jgi:hypothetical protein
MSVEYRAELPDGVEARDVDLKYAARRFRGEFPQIEAAKHFALVALGALHFGPYGCHAGVMPDQFTKALALGGHRAREALKAAIKLIDEIEEIERKEIAKNVG